METVLLVMPDITEITEIVCRVATIESIDPNAVLYESGVTSLDILGLLTELETVYGIRIPDEQFIAARTCQDLLCLVNRLKEEQTA